MERDRAQGRTAAAVEPTLPRSLSAFGQTSYGAPDALNPGASICSSMLTESRYSGTPKNPDAKLTMVLTMRSSLCVLQTGSVPVSVKLLRSLPYSMRDATPSWKSCRRPNLKKRRGQPCSGGELVAGNSRREQLGSELVGPVVQELERSAGLEPAVGEARVGDFACERARRSARRRVSRAVTEVNVRLRDLALVRQQRRRLGQSVDGRRDRVLR